MAGDDDARGEDDLDKEIAEALEGRSVFELATERAAPLAEDGTPLPDVPAGADVAAGGFHEGTVSGVGETDVFLEFGPREQGVVPRSQFATAPEVGARVRVFVVEHDDKESLWICAIRRQIQAADWSTLEVGALLSGVVRAANAGGLELQVGTHSAFLPASHIELERVEDMEAYVGRALSVEVVEADPERRRLVVSRRGILNRERDERRSAAASQLTPGSTHAGKVTRIEKYGAFVDLGGVEGLLHVSEMAHKRVERPEDVVSVGDDVRVQVLEVSEDGRRIGLSLKALQEDPWTSYLTTHRVGDVVEGTVTRLATYGAFVELIDGVEGLAHVSQLAPMPVRSPRDVLKVGERIGVRIATLEPERRRIGLSLLTERGDRLTDDIADDETIRRHTGGGAEDPTNVTLGDLLKKALEGGDGAA